MKPARIPYTRTLRLAATLSLLGQVSGIAFMLRTTPYTTFAFMTFGVGMIILGMAVFAFVIYKQVRARTDSLTEKRFQPGEYVFRQGTVGDRIYVVTRGEVEVLREDEAKGATVVAKLGAGEFFGEMALLTDAPRNASVRAATEATTLSIGREEFQSLYASIPAFHEGVEAAMARHRR